MVEEDDLKKVIKVSIQFLKLFLLFNSLLEFKNTYLRGFGVLGFWGFIETLLLGP